jgi:hypothetical protein
VPGGTPLQQHGQALGDQQPQQQGPYASAAWGAHRAPDGRRYYHNAATKESTWDKPQELMSPQVSPVRTPLQQYGRPLCPLSPAMHSAWQRCACVQLARRWGAGILPSNRTRPHGIHAPTRLTTVFMHSSHMVLDGTALSSACRQHALPLLLPSDCHCIKSAYNSPRAACAECMPLLTDDAATAASCPAGLPPLAAAGILLACCCGASLPPCPRPWLPQEKAEAVSGWREYTGPDGRKYYYHAASKASEWAMPEALRRAREATGETSCLPPPSQPAAPLLLPRRLAQLLPLGMERSALSINGMQM